jgi:hypothetical protein
LIDQDPVANWEKTASLLQSAQFLPHLTIKVSVMVMFFAMSPSLNTEPFFFL